MASPRHSIFVASFAALAWSATPARADEPLLAASVTLTSDYRFRGQSQSEREAAVQGSVDYSHPSGFFGGVWASNVDFDDPQQTPLEVDVTAGFSGALSDDVTTTITLTYYWYPGAADADYDYAGLSAAIAYGPFSLLADVNLTADYADEPGTAIGLAAAVQAPLSFLNADWLTASAEIGRQWVGDNDAYGTPDWNFYEVGLTASWDIFSLDARYSGTDLNRLECFGGTNLCQGGFVLSLTAAIS